MTGSDVQSYACVRPRIYRDARLSETCGVKWQGVGSDRPKTGTEIQNAALAKALQTRFEFTRADIDRFGVSNLSYNCYIKVDGKYFKPAVHPLHCREDERGLGEKDLIHLHVASPAEKALLPREAPLDLEEANEAHVQTLIHLLSTDGAKDALRLKPPYNIKVDIQSLRHLPQMDTLLGKCDSYVIVRCGDQEQRTKKKKNNLDPDFKETFEFKVTDSLQSLIVNVMDWEMSGRDEEVGSNQIQVGNLMAGTVAHQLTIRGSKDNNVVIGKDKEETTVLFSVTPEAIRRGQSHF